MYDQRFDFERIIARNQRFALSYILIAIGALGIITTFHFTELLGLGVFVVWVVSGSLICGGVFHLFNRLKLGLILGLAIQFCMLLFLLTQSHIVG